MTQSARSLEAEIPNESSSKWYINHLDAHITASKRQILGQTSILNPNKRSAYPTIVPPSNALWTPEEKEIFFASLRRHSRYRPDLISAQVGTKNEDEVDWYLDLLEYGAEITGQVDHNRRHEYPEPKIRYDGLRSWRKGLAPSARETSDRWIEIEEVLAKSVIKDIQQREEDELSIITKRNRRVEKRELAQKLEFIQDEDKLTPYKREKLFEEHPSYKGMENKWAIDDYLKEIDGVKLSELNGLMKPDWSTWYSDRIKPIKSFNYKPPPLDGENNNRYASPQERAEAEEADLETNAIAPKRVDPQGKIEMDQQNYLEIMAIPKKERTNEQRKLLTAITNRRRNREKYRIQKLMEEGMTKDEIDSAGGADAIFAGREKGDTAIAQPVSRRIKAKPESSAMVGKLRRMGMYDHLMMSGVEVFNFDMIRKVYKEQNPDRPSNISFSVLQGIHKLLVNELRRLIYHTLFVAEQAYLQRPGSEDDQAPEVEASHVHQVLLTLGLNHPGVTIIDFLERIFDEEGGDEQDREGTPRASDDDQDEDEGSEGSCDREDGTEEEKVSLRTHQFESSIFPPGEIPWHHLPHFDPDLNDQSTEDTEESYQVDEMSDAATELEGKELDDALVKLDEAHDATYERSLWKHVKKDTKGLDGDDRAEIWTMKYDGAKNDKSDQHLAEKGYISLLLSSDVARRKRKYIELIHCRYPTTRIKTLARANKRLKSNAWIIDSDSETEDEGGYVWNPNQEEREDYDSDISESDEGSQVSNDEDALDDEEQDELEDEKGDDAVDEDDGEFETEKGDPEE
ncbi:uncharacterized protein I206_107258 [Kwoniella pini CBS 10737]|uniref:Uncharacterized protein n=1 Tax=Kwoniella pini CBS 10737 TaxID=1296096 RepID=A0A1B9HYQ2_9TREE|nr:uncharacterized protein I206_05197 [Kwoniella pini CBS 10737]OCF48419.1 hypothetical protein I206_05197 [Kwoniella pini CBS 10737]